MKNRTINSNTALLTGTILLMGASLLTGCGGGGAAGSNDAAQNVASEPTIEGAVFASYMNGAQLSVEDVSGNVIAGPVLSDSMGQFKVKIDAAHLKTALIFKSTGGTFVDESTGSSTSGGALSVYVGASSLSKATGMVVNLTPGTTLIHQLVSVHGKTLAEAESSFEAAFGYKPDNAISPTDATSPEADATDVQKLAGLRAAAFSQLTQDLGFKSDQQFDLLNQLATDIADKNLDGMSQGTTEIMVNGRALGNDIQGKFAKSLITFKSGSKNKTALSNNEIGFLPFAKVALTDHYKVTYVPGKMSAMEGKSVFSITVSDLSGNAITGLSPEVKPIMNMASHVHASPLGVVSEDITIAGTYNVTAYYLMASKMSNGMSMGYWDVNVKIENDTVHFYPPVIMTMGNTVKAVLKGQNDKIKDMSTDSQLPRQYFVFNQGLKKVAGKYRFNVFIAAKESMMSFPALTSKTILNAGSPNELATTNIKVEMSTDRNTWTDATTTGDGIWTGANLSGLSESVKANIYIRLTVNAEQKTDDGKAVDGTADEAIFSVTPSSIDA